MVSDRPCYYIVVTKAVYICNRIALIDISRTLDTFDECFIPDLHNDTRSKRRGQHQAGGLK